MKKKEQMQILYTQNKRVQKISKKNTFERQHEDRKQQQEKYKSIIRLKVALCKSQTYWRCFVNVLVKWLCVFIER